MAGIAADPGYGFEGHKGYPNATHNDAIRRLGVTPHRRRSFDAAIHRKLGMRTSSAERRSRLMHDRRRSSTLDAGGVYPCEQFVTRRPWGRRRVREHGGENGFDAVVQVLVLVEDVGAIE